MNAIAIRIAGVVALAGTAVCASTAVALTPAGGNFRGQVQQADRLADSPTVAFTVTRARRVARVATADVSSALRCEDGTSFARTMHLPSAPIKRGAFRIQESNGGGFGAEGRIRLSVLFRGRFQTSGLAHGTLRARCRLGRRLRPRRVPHFFFLRFSGRRGQRLQSGFDLQHFFLTFFAIA